MVTKKLYQWFLLAILFISSSAVAQQMPGDTRTPGIFGRGQNRPVSNPDGSMRMPDGSTQYPDGTVVYPDGTVRYPNGRTTQQQQNRPPVYGNQQHQCNSCTCSMPPGQAKKMYRGKSAKGYAHGKKQCQQKNRNDRYDDDDDDRYENRNVRRYPQYPQTYPQYPQYPQYPMKEKRRF